MRSTYDNTKQPWTKVKNINSTIRGAREKPKPVCAGYYERRYDNDKVTTRHK